MKLAAAVAKLVWQFNAGGTIAVPITAPSLFEGIAIEYGGKVIRTSFNNYAQNQAALGDGVVLSTDGEGGFIFPQFHPAKDALFTVAKIIELSIKAEVRLSEVISSLPNYALVRTKVNCSWEDKGKVMRILNDQYRNPDKQIDGVRINLGEEWVLIFPDADRPIFHVLAESHSSDQAQILVDKYAGVVRGLQR